MIALDSPHRGAKTRTPRPKGARGLDASLAVPPSFPAPQPVGEGDLVAGTASTHRDDTLGSDNAAPAAKPTGALRRPFRLAAPRPIRLLRWRRAPTCPRPSWPRFA